MSDEVKITIIAAFTIVLVAICIVFGVAFHTRQFINGGYCEGSIPGISGTAWVKCN